MNIIGTRLRELRQSAKLSQVKIAEVVGSRQSAIARFESGEVHVPAEVMIRYADYFDVPRRIGTELSHDVLNPARVPL